MKKVILGLFVTAALFGCSQNAKKDGVPMEKSNKEGAAMQDTTAPVAKSNLQKAKSDELLPEVAEAYKGIVVAVANVKGGSNTEIELPFGKEVKIDGSPLAITIQSYFPDFIMVDGGVANKSMNENNPGSKVIIKKDGAVIFDGWLFQKFPEAHGFEDPDFKVVMVKGSPAKAATPAK